MLARRCPGDFPKLLEPLIVLFLRDHAEFPLTLGRLTVPSRLPLHQNEFHIILYDRVWFVWLTEEFRSVIYLVTGVCDFVPDDRVEIVESNLAARHSDIRVQWKNDVTAKVPARQAHVSDDAHQPTAWHQDTIHFLPDFCQFTHKLFVVGHVSQLVWVLVVPFERPVRRRGEYEVNGLVLDEGDVPCITLNQAVRSPAAKSRPDCARRSRDEVRDEVTRRASSTWRIPI